MQELLGYESRDQAALEPGEELIWEGGGVRRGRARFRITNRRAFCVDGKENIAKHRATVRWPFHHTISVVLPRHGRPSVRFGAALWITHLDDWAAVAGSLVNLNRGRLTRRRRAVKPTENSMSVLPVSETAAPDSGIDHSSVTLDLGLLDNERVVWSGRPVRHPPIRWSTVRRKMIVVALLVFPSLMAIRVATEKHFEPMDTVLGMVAAGWFLITLHSLTTKPILACWRLRRTQYVLTTRRAFVIEPFRTAKRVRFIFVDSLGARFDRIMQDDGSGDVNIGQGIFFTQVPDAATVHQQLTAAVLTARRDLPDLGWHESPMDL